MFTSRHVTTTLGKYTLLRKIATGGMAEVFLARAEGPGGFSKRCVVKRILPHYNDDPRFIEMFLGEARLAAELNHPNLVQIFDFGQDHNQYYLAMEYIDGLNLRALNQAARAQLGPMSFALAARIINLAAEGLHFAHELRNDQGEFLNLIHRDISPDNILVSRNGSVKVVDFGIAKATTQPHLTKSGLIKGKMAYMPPEQLAREPLDRRADLFALGIVFYELITGGFPFETTSEISIIQAIMSREPLERPSVFRRDCPPEVEAIVARCLEKDREKRYPSCLELQADLERYIRGTGMTVGTREIAQLISTVCAPEVEGRIDSSSGLEKTLQAGRTPEPQAVPLSQSNSTAQRPAGLVEATLAQQSKEVAPPPHAVKTSAVREELRALQKSSTRVKWATAAALLSLSFGVIAWLTLKDPPTVAPTTAPLTTVVPVVPVDAGMPALTEESPSLPSDTTLVAIPQSPLDAGNSLALPEPVEAPPHSTPRHGRLELRIRPYATVYLDDKKLGDTPLPVMSLAAGKHELRLRNSQLGKDVLLPIVIKPGETLVTKYNLKD